MSRPVITLLYVPGDRPDRFAKALASGADVVIVDLEDAVRPDAKAAARDDLRSLLGGVDPSRGLQVRVNALTTKWVDADLAAVSALPPGVGVRIPKCEDPLAAGRPRPAAGLASAARAGRVGAGGRDGVRADPVRGRWPRSGWGRPTCAPISG